MKSFLSYFDWMSNFQFDLLNYNFSVLKIRNPTLWKKKKWGNKNENDGYLVEKHSLSYYYRWGTQRQHSTREKLETE